MSLNTFTHDLYDALPTDTFHKDTSIPNELIEFHACMLEHHDEWEKLLQTNIILPTLDELWYKYKLTGRSDWYISSPYGNVSMYITFSKTKYFAWKNM